MTPSMHQLLWLYKEKPMMKAPGFSNLLRGDYKYDLRG